MKINKGLKELFEESPDQVQKIIRALKGESDDAVSTLGSGKNLQALQAAKADIPVPTNSPFIPKSMDVSPNGAQKLPINPDDLVASPSVTSEVLTPPKQMIKNAPATLAETADELKGSIDDTLVSSTPNTLKKGLAVGAGALGLAGGLSMLDGSQEAPAAELPVEAKSPAINKQPGAVKNPDNKADLSKEKVATPNTAAKMVKEEEKPTTANEVDDYIKMMKQAQYDDDMNQSMNKLASAGSRIGHGLARLPVDEAVLAARMNVDKGKHSAQLKQIMETDADSKKLKKAQTDLDDDTILRDPTSDISKAFRSSLAKLGIPHSDKTTGADAKAMGINIQNLLMQDRSLAMQDKLATKKQAAISNNFVTGANKMLLKPFQEYQKVASAKQSLEGYLTGESSGPKDVAILYEFIKGLDPSSSVKEGEIELGKSAMSLLEQYGIKAQKLTKGEILSPAFRSAIQGILKDKESLAKSNYDQVRQPLLRDATARGLESGDYQRFDPMSAMEADAQTREPQGEQTVNEVERLDKKSGKIAIFDAATKQFIRYKD